MRRTCAAFVVTLLLLGAAPARADHVVAVISVSYTYLPSEVQVERGHAMGLWNLDRDIHSLTAVATGPDGGPLFDTPRGGVTWTQLARVEGIDDLAPGSYDFFCRYHPALPTMRGTLHLS